MTDWLPHDLLLKLDRCLMAHAVEGRTPFLDPGVAAAAFRLPDAHEAARRAWASGSCASGWRSICRWRGRSRRSRASPCRSANGSRAQGARLGPLVAAQPGVAEIADPAKVAAAVQRTSDGWRHGFACWKLLFYALWHRRHILALPPAGDVFETLSAP